MINAYEESLYLAGARDMLLKMYEGDRMAATPKTKAETRKCTKDHEKAMTKALILKLLESKDALRTFMETGEMEFKWQYDWSDKGFWHVTAVVEGGEDEDV